MDPYDRLLSETARFVEAPVAAVAFAVFRVWIGAVFTAHGLEKLFGALGGQGRAAWRASVERQGYRPVGLYALLVPLGELVCGPLLALGLLTPLAAGFLSVELIVAIRKIHGPKGLFNFAGGWEFQGTLLLVLAMLGIGGAGAVSFDGRLALDLGAPTYAVVLVAGLIVALPGLMAPAVATTGRRAGGGG